MISINIKTTKRKVQQGPYGGFLCLLYLSFFSRMVGVVRFHRNKANRQIQTEDRQAVLQMNKWRGQIKWDVIDLKMDKNYHND